MSNVIFPSTEWFEALGLEMDADRDLHTRIGEIDLTCVFSILDGPRGDTHIRLTFEEFSLVEVRELDAGFDVSDGIDFVLEGDFEDWQEMLENLHHHGKPDREHTLNYLSLPGTPLRCWSPDPLGRDMFFRFNQSLQTFVNAAHRLDVTSAASL